MRHQEIVEHSLPIVPTKDIYPVVPSHDGVFAALGTNKLLTLGELLPLVEWLPRVEVQSHILLQIKAEGNRQGRVVRGLGNRHFFVYNWSAKNQGCNTVLGWEDLSDVWN